MELECYAVDKVPPEIVPGRPQRGWMDAFTDRHPYRCLPMTMANTTGWEILCPMGFTAEWNGGVQATDIRLLPDHPHPHFHEFVKSHFSHGVLTFHPGYLFRTPADWSMWCMGPPNHIKDGIQPLVGLVETDWLPFPFTMNWKFTRPGRVHFAKSEPFCFITLTQDKTLETVDVTRRRIENDPDLRAQYMAWYEQRQAFNARLAKSDPMAMKEAWQRFYFKGEMPDETGPAPKAHVNKRRLKSPRMGR